MTNEKINGSDALAEALKGFTIKDAKYSESDSANEKYAKSDTASDPKVNTHTSHGKKIKVTDTSNKNLQQQLLINQTLLIITTTIESRINDKVETCGRTPHALAIPTTKGIITDAAHRSTQVLRAPGYVRRISRDGNIPRDCGVAVRSPRDNGPFLIECIIVPPNHGAQWELGSSQ